MKRKLEQICVVIFLILAIHCFVLSNLPKEKNEVDVEYYTYQFLIDNNLTPIQASAILANIKFESDFDPTATARNDSGYGLLQWCGIRKENLEHFAKEIDKPIDNTETQLMFLMEEINSESKYYAFVGEFSNLEDVCIEFLKSKNPKEAAKYFTMMYKMCGMSKFDLIEDLSTEYWETFNLIN